MHYSRVSCKLGLCLAINDLLRPHADDGEEAAALGAFLAVAEEEVAAAGGAEIGDADVRGAEASADELGAIGFAEIKKDVPRRRLMAGGHHVEPLDGIGLVAGAELVEPFRSFGKLRLKLGSDFGADFVAAAADGWADGGEKVGGPGLEVHLHLADGFDDDALERAAPAGVNMGTQSAVWMPRRRPGRLVTEASPATAGRPWQGSAGGASKRWMTSEWICFREMSFMSEAPSAD